MLRTDEILSTIQMLHAEHLDVRSVTLGLNLDDCSAPSLDHLCRKVRQKIVSRASRLVEVCDRVGAKYGIPVINKRVAISPAATLLAGHGHGSAVQLAKTLDAVADECRVDFVGGFTALVHKGISPGDWVVMESLPEVLSQTKRVCASLNVASRRAGINMDAIQRMGHILLKIADGHGRGARLRLRQAGDLCQYPRGQPLHGRGLSGAGEPEAVVNIGVSGPGVVCSALRRRLAMEEHLTLGDLAEEIKITSFRVTRVGELIGREVAAELGVEFGIVDLSLAPTPTVGDSVGEILKTLGIAAIGAPGSTAAVAMLNDAVKKGGLFASSSVGGLSGAFIPVSEDAALADAVGRGHLVLEKLEAMTSVCSVGLDMVAIPGDTPAETIAAIIADEMAIGVINDKTTAVRLIPVPGAKAGDIVDFGGLFGSTPVMEVRNSGASTAFVRFGGRIPAPMQSLRN